MLNTFSKFASIDNVKKYKAEVTEYTSAIRQFKGFNVEVYLLSPYDSCNREPQVQTKSSVDADFFAARMGLNPTLVECIMVLPEGKRYSWRVFRQIAVSKYEYSSKQIMYKQHFKVLKVEGCVGRVGDLCILKNLHTGMKCNLKCKWHGQYDLFDTDMKTKAFNTCRTITDRLPVFKRARIGEYPIICNKSYPIRNRQVSYKCAGNTQIGYYVYRPKTKLELNRLS